MYLVKTPTFVQKIYKSLTWTIASQDNVYVSFDDGPDPECTPWVLDTLNQFGAKATFFCIGKNAEQYPELIERINSEGHALGNHSYSHQSGWSTKTEDYINDVNRCDEIMNAKLFRPPYGKLKPSQITKLKSRYKIIMWDVMSGDFDESITKDQCLANVTELANAGSIVLFHDSKKCFDKLSYVLPKALKLFENEGLSCKVIPA